MDSQRKRDTIRLDKVTLGTELKHRKTVGLDVYKFGCYKLKNIEA